MMQISQPHICFWLCGFSIKNIQIQTGLLLLKAVMQMAAALMVTTIGVASQVPTKVASMAAFPVPTKVASMVTMVIASPVTTKVAMKRRATT
mgnify:CR=1 FL=1